VPVEGGRAVVTQAVRVLDERRLDVDDIGLRRPTLDEVFLSLTGSPAGDPTDPTEPTEAGGDDDRLVRPGAA
jgi:ABC-2 type transport system ATP-binding protein